jgi:arsenite methyltransferase
MTTQPTDQDTLREQVRARYAAAATKAIGGDCGCGQPADCGCGGGCCGTAATAEEPGFGAEQYAALDRDQLPETAVLASLGCGNPTAVADLARARRSWTWALAAGSTCCCRPSGSAPPARPTGWT